MSDLQALTVTGSGVSRAATAAAARGLQQITLLGMYRSGTSALAGALVDAGAWAGDATDLRPADQHNLRGYFERDETGAVLEGILTSLGGSWTAPPVSALSRLDLEPFRDPLRALFGQIAHETPEGRIPLVKDPRLSLFASELPTVLGSSDGLVVCVRHPLAVARSLRARDGIPLTTGLALWECYNVAICRGLSGRAVRVRSFGPDSPEQLGIDAFIEGLLGAVGRPRRADAPLLSSSHVVAGLVHQHADAEDEQQWLSAAQMTLWQALSEAARSPQPTALEAVELSALAEQELLRPRTPSASVAVAVPAVPVLDSDRTELLELQAAHAALAAELEVTTARVAELESAAEASAVAHRDLSAALTRAVARERAATGDLDGALEGWLEADRAREQAVADVRVGYEQLLADLADEQRSLLVSLDGFRGIYEELTTAYVRTTGELDGPDRADLQEWLETLHLGSAGTGSNRATQDAGARAVPRIEELELALREAMIAVDSGRGFLGQVESLWLQAHPGRYDVTVDELLTWVADRGQATYEVASWTTDRPTRDQLSRLAAAERELEALRDNRDEVVRMLVSITSSESWRLGHALTWPVRTLRRGPKNVGHHLLPAPSVSE